MRSNFLGLLAAVLAATLLSARTGGLQHKLDYFSITTDPDDYPHPELALAALVQQDGHAKLNHFCVVGIRGNGGVSADLFWLENNTLTLWDPGGEDDSWTLLHSRRVWDLKKDVVPAGADAGIFLISQTEVDETRAACKKVGNSFVIRKTPRRGKS